MDLQATLAFCGSFCAAVIGLAGLILGRRTMAQWLFAAGMGVLALEAFCAGTATDAIFAPQIVYWESWRLCAMSFLPAVWLAFSVSYARGNARQNVIAWRVPLMFASLVPLTLAFVFRESLLGSVSQAADRGSRTILLQTPGNLLELCFVFSLVLILMNLERTFRSSVGTMRWKIKFLILGLGALFAVRIYTSTQELLFNQMDLALHTLNSGALLVGCFLILRSLLRADQFEVSVYPSQAMLYNSLTVLLAGIYLVIVGVLSKLVVWFGGTSSFPFKSFLVLVALVLLTLVLVSDRVRLQIRRFVSRNFQRPLHDYRNVWRTFTEGTARCIERNELCMAVVNLVSKMFQALSVSVWLVDDSGPTPNLVFAKSTSISEAKAAELQLTSSAAAEIITALSHKPEPRDIDTSQESWAIHLRRCQPDEFSKGGHRICVPMIAAGELLGIMVLGDRVGGVPFSLQDFDLLKCVSDHAAASLLNIQLSQRLSQGKQLEAFQAMSAFFVHDLKNTASTLSLMLQNLPVHYQDPAFREDALRGISKTVGHINDLISRLSVLRHELAIQPLECDLNELIKTTLDGQDQTRKVELREELRSLPKLRLDPIQIGKVVTNLFLNAAEAVGPGGQVRVETLPRNGWVVISVIDNGCGMSAEFIQHRLFRPFQTTKQRGIGIGMFHCKMIVEAHRGRIEVESEPGKGTTFRVLLPQAI